MVKQALQLKSVAKLSPLFIFDNAERLVENGKVKPGAIDFLTWCQEMSNLGLMNFVMISNDHHFIQSLQKCAIFLLIRSLLNIVSFFLLY